VLGGGEVHVWHVELEGVSEELLGALSAEEQARAERIERDPARRLWSRSRGVLRALLARYLQCDANAPQLVTGEQGKPALAPRVAGGSQLHFNLSHSGPRALYALTELSPVGVDIQLARERGARGGPDYLALARRAFGASEAERLQQLDEQLREREFLRRWARHEAASKRDGHGLGARAGGDGGDRGGEGWVVDLDAGPRAGAAVALELPAQVLRCWSWSEPG
jgi:4'-phosphopantetheinyl transferase